MKQGTEGCVHVTGDNFQSRAMSLACAGSGASSKFFAVCRRFILGLIFRSQGSEKIHGCMLCRMSHTSKTKAAASAFSGFVILGEQHSLYLVRGLLGIPIRHYAQLQRSWTRRKRLPNADPGLALKREIMSRSLTCSTCVIPTRPMAGSRTRFLLTPVISKPPASSRAFVGLPGVRILSRRGCFRAP